MNAVRRPPFVILYAFMPLSFVSLFDAPGCRVSAIMRPADVRRRSAAAHAPILLDMRVHHTASSSVNVQRLPYDSVYVIDTRPSMMFAAAEHACAPLRYSLEYFMSPMFCYSKHCLARATR